MFHRAKIRGYRALLDVDIDLAPLTVLIGANASGKSSVLEALDDLMSLSAQSAATNNQNWRLAELFPAPSIESRVSRCSGAPRWFSVELEGARTLGMTARLPDPGRPDWDTTYDVTVDGAAFSLPEKDNGRAISNALSGLEPALLLAPDPASLVDPSVPRGRVPSIGRDGSGLGATVQYLLGQRDGRFEGLEKAVCAVLPRIRRLRTVPRPFTHSARRRVRIDGYPELWSDEPAEHQGVALEADFAGTGWIDQRFLSEGTLLVIALLTSVIQAPTRLLLLDDLERGLHPTAQRALTEALRELRASRPDLQIVATTHSPYLLDELDPGEIRVLAVGPDGAARCRPFDAHPEWPQRRDFGSRPGEFWSDGGESWVLAEPP